MSRRVVFRRAAQAEFDEAVAWYEARRAGLGRQFVDAVEEAPTHAAGVPLCHPVIHRDVRRVQTRRFPYSLMFRVRPDRLVVVAVFHGRRDPKAWKRRG